MNNNVKRVLALIGAVVMYWVMYFAVGFFGYLGLGATVEYIEDTWPDD